jgi:hypothetical protein
LQSFSIPEEDRMRLYRAHNPNRPWEDELADALLVMVELPKNPCDLNEWQKLLVDMATGFAGD